MQYTHFIQGPGSLKDLEAWRDQKMAGGPMKTWRKDQFDMDYHFATPEEVREYLNLCQELAGTFEGRDCVHAIEMRPFAINPARYVAGLLEKAGVSLVMRDWLKLWRPEDYLWNIPEEMYECQEMFTVQCEQVGFDNPLLRSAVPIAAASSLVGHFERYWTALEERARWLRRLQILGTKLKEVGLFRWSTKRNNSHKKIAAETALEANARDLHFLNRLLRRALELCYGKQLIHGFPMIYSSVVPLAVSNSLFAKGSKDILAMMRQDWETSSLYLRFGEEKLLRMIELHRYTMKSIQVRAPEVVKTGNYASLDLKGIRKYYPDFPIDLLPYCVCTGMSEKYGEMQPSVMAVEMMKGV